MTLFLDLQNAHLSICSKWKHSEMSAETSMLPLKGQGLCQFITYNIKRKYVDMNRLPRQENIASQDKG